MVVSCPQSYPGANWELGDLPTRALRRALSTHYTRNHKTHNQKGTHAYNNQKPLVRWR